MAGYDLGKAYIQIVPSSKGMGRSIERELGGVGGRASKTMGGKLWGGLKAGAATAGIAIGGILTGSVVKGFNRLKDIENAEAKLSGLGHSADDVQKIMDNALEAVLGTSYGMEEAATAAASAVAAGVEPGKELEKYLSLVGDTAAIAGVEFNDMGAIFGKVMTSGKVQGDIFNQLSDAGIPVVQMLSDELGVAAEEVYAMGSAGEISSDDFLSAMGSMEGAALELGGTTEGAWKNMGAAMGRFGAVLLQDVYPLIGPLLGKVTDFFDYLSDRAGPAIESVVGKFREWAESDQVQGMLTILKDVGVELYERVLKPLGTWIADNWKPIAAVVGGIFAAFAGGALIAAVGAVGAAIGGIFSVAGVVTAAIGAVVGGLAYFFTQTEAGQAIVSTAWGMIQTAVSAVVEWFKTSVWPVMLDGWEYLKWAVSETWPVIQQVFGAIGSYIQQIWTGVIQPALSQFMGFLRDTVMPIIERLWTDYVQPAFMAIGALTQWLWYNVISPALSAMAGFISGTLAPAIVWLWENVVSPVFGLIGRFIGWVWNTLIFPYLDALKHFVLVVLPPAMIALWENIKRVWNGISNAIGAVVSWFQTWVWPVIQLVIELIKLGFNTMRDALGRAWTFIKDRVIAPVVAWFRDTVAPLFSAVINRIKAYFVIFRGKIREVWSNIRHKVIDPVVKWFRDTVGPIFDNATGGIGDAFTKLKDVVKTAWENIKSAAKAPIRFVVETVINDALIGNFNKLADKLGTTKLPSVSLPSGFARGGVLPGMSSMRDGDDQLVPMRRGEGVLVSEGLRTAKDRAAFMAANAAGRRGVGFASLMGGGFAGGGILDKVKDVGSHAWDKITSGADWIASALADPGAAFSKLVDGLIGGVPGSGLLRDAAIAAPKKLAGSLADRLLSATGPDSDVSVGKAPAGSSRSLSYARSLASSMGLTMTSFRRAGARTAGSGSLSLHAQGRAMDFSNSSGPTPQMMRFFNAMHPLKPTELLYSPAGGRQWRRSGRMANTTGRTRSGHFNHVHVGFNEGGIFDQGGLMQPGMTGINLTKKPEAVLDPKQTRAYQAHAAAITDGAMELSATSIEALADALASRPNVVQIGTRTAGQLAMAGAQSRKSLGGR